MNEEVLIPKMKRPDKKRGKIQIPILNFVLIFFGILLIICSAFICINLRHYIIPHGIFENINLTAEDFIYSIPYIPQIPILMFVCSSLGKKSALTCVILYLLAGLTFLPIFGMGGGLHYITEYSFGYLLAYIPAVVIAGQFLRKEYTFLTMLRAAISGVLIIHICGILYMMLIALLKQDGFEFISGWTGAQSGIKIIYDLVFGYVFVMLGKYINAFIKFVS